MASDQTVLFSSIVAFHCTRYFLKPSTAPSKNTPLQKFSFTSTVSAALNGKVQNWIFKKHNEFISIISTYQTYLTVSPIRTATGKGARTFTTAPILRSERNTQKKMRNQKMSAARRTRPLTTILLPEIVEFWGALGLDLETTFYCHFYLRLFAITAADLFLTAIGLVLASSSLR